MIGIKIDVDRFLDLRSKLLLITDGLVRKKPVQRQSSADNSFPTIINMDDDMVMV